MKKTCNKCYHFKNERCQKTNVRVNATKQRDKCKHYRTNAPRGNHERGNLYGYDLEDTIRLMSYLKNKSNGQIL